MMFSNKHVSGETYQHNNEQVPSDKKPDTAKILDSSKHKCVFNSDFLCC